jgi:hypothetical protein
MEFVIYLKDHALHILMKSRRALAPTIRGSWNKQEHHMRFNARLLKNWLKGVITPKIQLSELCPLSNYGA